MVTRRDVVESYVRYDARKKGGAVPSDISEWDWSHADAIDQNLRLNGFKFGILAGYEMWRPVNFGVSELRDCAIVADIFPNLPRVLGQLVNLELFENWKPDRHVEWLDSLRGDAPYPSEWPLILRPSVRSERPAKWYLEDGSGRGICFFRRLVRAGDDRSTAFGYLGSQPDSRSTFMRQNFSELLA